MLFDTHAHYDDERFTKDLDEVLNKAFDSGVGYILNASSSPASIKKCVHLAESYEKIFGAVGVHPHDASNITDEVLSNIEALSQHPKVVAIGEIGLDYHYDFSPRELQKKWFRYQLELAKRVKLPIIIHNRESTEDVLAILKETSAKDVGGVFHCFSGSIETAKILLDNNFYLSFGGAITFKNARKTLEVLEKLPLEKILIETDAPYLTPEPFRGKRNDSSYVGLVASKIAEVKRIEIEEVRHQTTKNGMELFGIKKFF
jgi:TatD DNase family protein